MDVTADPCTLRMPPDPVAVANERTFTFCKIGFRFVHASIDDVHGHAFPIDALLMILGNPKLF
jgi:hypothetical protein